jgi:hypothetical protein
MKIKSLVSIVIIATVLSFSGLVSMQSVQAVSLQSDVCDQGIHLHNPHCITPTLTPRPTATPTVTPTPQPTATPTPRDERDRHCSKHLRWWASDHRCHKGDEPTPTPTPGCVEDCVTPTPTPSPIVVGDNGGGWSPTPSGQNSTTNAPGAPSCTIPFPAPILQGGVRINSTTVSYTWWPSLDQGVDFQAIVFGYAADSLSMGDLPIDKHVTQLNVTLLHANAPVYAQIWSFKGGCAERSTTLRVR